MTDLATSAVEMARQALGEAESWAAHCRAEAQRAADRLISEPSVELVQARDQARAQAEVADLELERVKRQLEQAQEQAREDAIGELLSGAGEIQTRASEADEALWRSLGEHEAALETVLGCRLELRRLNGRLAQLGYRGYALQLARKPRQGEYRRRIEGLQGQYSKVVHPLMMLPVAGGE
jgi:hypothetical protein